MLHTTRLFISTEEVALLRCNACTENATVCWTKELYEVRIYSKQQLLLFREVDISKINRCFNEYSDIYIWSSEQLRISSNLIL